MTHPNPTTLSPSIVAEIADHDLYQMISRHNELYEKCGRDEEPSADLVSEMCSLELRIAARPAHTKIGLIGKQMVIERACFSREAMEVIEAILADDLARIG